MSVRVTLTVVEACEANTLIVSALLVINGIVTTSVPHVSIGGTCSISMSQGSFGILAHSCPEKTDIGLFPIIRVPDMSPLEPEDKKSETSE